MNLLSLAKLEIKILYYLNFGIQILGRTQAESDISLVPDIFNPNMNFRKYSA